MKPFLLLGKLITLLFWGLVLVNLYQPLAQPFDLLLRVAGGTLLALHIVQMLSFNRRLNGAYLPFVQRLQVLLFGMFHVLGLPAHTREPAAQLAVAGAPELITREDAGNAQNPSAAITTDSAGSGSSGN